MRAFRSGAPCWTMEWAARPAVRSWCLPCGPGARLGRLCPAPALSSPAMGHMIALQHCCAMSSRLHCAASCVGRSGFVIRMWRRRGLHTGAPWPLQSARRIAFLMYNGLRQSLARASACRRGARMPGPPRNHGALSRPPPHSAWPRRLVEGCMPPAAALGYPARPGHHAVQVGCLFIGSKTDEATLPDRDTTRCRAAPARPSPGTAQRACRNVSCESPAPRRAEQG